MAAEWADTTLGEVVSFLSGGTPSKDREDLWTGPIPWVSAKDMKQFQIEDTEDHVSESAIGNGTRLAPAGTVLLLTRGMTLLNDIPICVAKQPMAFNQDVKAIRPNSRVDPAFVPYLLLGNKERLLSLVDLAGHGTGRLNTDELKALDVALPPIDQQRAMVHILGTLDDKIELNRRMSETLEAMARALFESWFDSLDVHRVRVDELASAGVLEIGDGYRAKNSELGEPGLPFIRAGNLDNGFDTEGAETLRSESVLRAGSKLSRPGDIAFTSKGTVGRFGRVHEHVPAFVYSPQVCFWRSLRPDLLEPSILFLWMRSSDLRVQIEGVAGQTDMAPYVSLRDQRAMEVPSFPASQHLVARRLDLLLARQAIVTLESRALASLRDSLLPKLLSGRLQLADLQLSNGRGSA